MDDLVESGEARVVLPTTDTGYKTYGAGRLLLPAGTNYWTNPRLKEGAANDWGYGLAGAYHGSLVHDILPNGDGTWYYECVYTVHADDLAGGGHSVTIYNGLGAGTFTNGDPITLAIEYQFFSSNARSVSTGPALATLDQAYGDAIGGAGLPVATSWTRAFVSGECGAATTSRIVWNKMFAINNTTGVVGDTLTFRMRYPSLTKSAVLTPYFDGSSPACAWTAAADESASTRTVSALEYSDYVTLSSVGVTAAGTNVAYAQNSSGTYYGPVVVTPEARSAGWQTIAATLWSDPVALFGHCAVGDIILPLGNDSVGYRKVA